MPVSISILRQGLTAGRADVIRFDAPVSGGTIVFHPRFQSWLAKIGLDSAESVFEREGEIICGHPSRNVSKFTVDRRRVLYLKKEHIVGWQVRLKNQIAGFGFVSRSEREAMTLQCLERFGLPAPQWLAYGTTADDRAFLLIDELTGHIEINDVALNPDVAMQAGSTVSRFHESGITTPDLSRKHLFIHPETGEIRFIDWLNSSRPGTVNWADRIFALSRFVASFSFVSPESLDQLVGSYLSKCRGEKPTIEDVKSRIVIAASKWRTKSTVFEQKHEGDSIRLVWKDSERLVTVPDLPWPQAWNRATSSQRFEWTSFDLFGRWFADFRNKPWRSPAAVASRLLAQLQKAGVRAPRLHAYGQTLHSFGRGQSFLLTDQPASTFILTRPQLIPTARLVREAHDAGVRIRPQTRNEPILCDAEGQPVLNAIPAWFRCRKNRIAPDLVLVLKQFAGTISGTDRMRFVREYLRHGSSMIMSRRMIRLIVKGESR